MGMNDNSWNIIQEMITNKDELKIDLVETPVGILIDAGVKTPGSIKKYYLQKAPFYWTGTGNLRNTLLNSGIRSVMN